MFDKFKDMYGLQKQARQLKKELKNTHIEAEVDGITVVVDGEQEVVSVTFSEEHAKDPRKLGENLVKAINKAIKKSQQIAADKMKPLMNGLNLPGNTQA
jgi:DNA-binding protein YbaB